MICLTWQGRKNLDIIKKVIFDISIVMLLVSIFILGAIIAVSVIVYLTGSTSDILLYDLGHLFWILLQISFGVGMHYFIKNTFTFKCKKK